MSGDHNANQKPRAVVLDPVALGKRMDELARDIDARHAGKLALLLECMLHDPTRWWDDAARALDDYRSEWNQLNPWPSPLGKD